MANALPKSEKYRLTDQLIRASRSVTANIAEGFGRYHYQENIQFCRQARGSMQEILDHLSCVLDEQYISKAYHDQIVKQCEATLRLLNGYIRYLQKAKSRHIK